MLPDHYTAAERLSHLWKEDQYTTGVRLWMLPLAGELQVRVVGVTQVSIHGDIYYECLLQTQEQIAVNQASKVRLPSHACAGLPGGAPEPGDLLAVGFLMQQPTSVRLIAARGQTREGTPPQA